MKHFIPHRILVIPEHVLLTANDDVLFHCYKLAFDWANHMGLEGKMVYDIFLEKPNCDKDPMNNLQAFLWCKIECTMDEREKWEAIQKMNVQNAVLTALQDD